MELKELMQTWWATLRKKIEVRGKGADRLYHYEAKAKQLKPCFDQKTAFDDITPEQIEELYKAAAKGQLGVILPGGQGARIVTTDPENILSAPEVQDTLQKETQKTLDQPQQKEADRPEEISEQTAAEGEERGQGIPDTPSAPAAPRAPAAPNTPTAPNAPVAPTAPAPAPKTESPRAAEPQAENITVQGEDMKNETREERKAALKNELAQAQSADEEAKIYQQMLLEDEEEEERRKRLELLKIQAASNYFLAFLYEEQKIAEIARFERAIKDGGVWGQMLKNLMEPAKAPATADEKLADPDFEPMTTERRHYVSGLVSTLGDQRLLQDEKHAREVIDAIVSGKDPNALKSSAEASSAAAAMQDGAEVPPMDGAMLGNSLRQLSRYVAGEYPLSSKHVEVARLCSDMLNLAKENGLGAEELQLDPNEFTAVLGTIELGRIVKRGLAAKESLSGPNPPAGEARTAALRDYLTMSAVDQAIAPHAKTLEDAAIARDEAPLSSMQVLLGSPGFSGAELGHMIARSPAMRQLISTDNEGIQKLIDGPNHEMDDLARRAMSSCYDGSAQKTHTPAAAPKPQATKTGPQASKR